MSRTKQKSYSMTNASEFRRKVRAKLKTRVKDLAVKIEREFCRQEGTTFWPGDISLDTDCLNTADFVYSVETEDTEGNTMQENRTLGRLTHVEDFSVYLHPIEVKYEETDIDDLDTDTLFKLCTYLETSLTLLKQDGK